MEEREYVKEKIVKILAVQVITNPYSPDEIQKINFETAENGRITHKPKQEIKEFRHGLEYISVGPGTTDKLPEIVSEIGKQMQLNGFAMVKVNYAIWNTEKEGVAMAYKYVQHRSQLDKWEIISEEKVE